MRNYLRYWIYLIVTIGFSCVHSGSYDDYFVAIKRDDARAITQLLQRGFDANTLSPDGEHGLLLALRESSLKVVQVLLGWPKTQVETRNAVDESPLMMAAFKGHIEIVRALIARGADINKTGWTPLHYAATGSHNTIVSLLLEEHAYIDAESPNGTTPLMMAAQYGSAATVRQLLEAGADASLKNQLGLTAQDFAVRSGRREVSEMIAAHLRRQRPAGAW